HEWKTIVWRDQLERPPHEPQNSWLDYQQLVKVEVHGFYARKARWGNSHPGPLPQGEGDRSTDSSVHFARCSWGEFSTPALPGTGKGLRLRARLRLGEGMISLPRSR